MPVPLAVAYVHGARVEVRESFNPPLAPAELRPLRAMVGHDALLRQLRVARPRLFAAADDVAARALIEHMVGSGRWELVTTATRPATSCAPRVVDLADLAGPALPSSRLASETRKTTTWFEVVVVDELGVPAPGIPVNIRVDGALRTVHTDSDGRARIEDTSSAVASASFAETEQLRDVLHDRWRQVRDGDDLEPADERTVLQLRDTMPAVALRAERPHVISVQPRVVLARLLGLFFETDKAFLLPTAMGGIQGVRRLYDDNPGATVLAVGHTDTRGRAGHNLTLSIDRAESVRAYLRDDVEAWLDFYDRSRRTGQRWGSREDVLMIEAMPDAATREHAESPVRWYQRTRGLAVDGIAGPNTRRRLIGQYMDFDATSLPSSTSAEVHGCGEHFPRHDVGDHADVAANRRVELLFFEREVLPPPPGPTSSKTDPQYPEWLKRARETHDFWPGQHVLDALHVSWTEATVDTVPPMTVLSLQGEGIPLQELALSQGQRADGIVTYRFDNAPTQPCTLTARAGDQEVVLWRDQVAASSDAPFEWDSNLAELTVSPEQTL